MTLPKERLETIRKNAPWLAWLHFAVMVYGAAEKEPFFILIGIAALIIGNILGAEPNKSGENRRIRLRAEAQARKNRRGVTAPPAA